MGETDKKLIENGKRLDGRAPNELRPIKIEVGVLHRADGSCYLEWGGNKVIAGVFGPRECFPRHAQNPFKARLRYRYNMAPFSVEDRKRPGPDRRSSEISKISREAFENVVFLEQFPKATIDVYVEVLQADAGTRCAALTAASVALADAGIPMKGLVASCASGKIDDVVVLDLGKLEDNAGQADLPLAMIPENGEILLMQMDGDLSPDQLNEAYGLAVEGIKKIGEIQKQALRDKYNKQPEEVGEENEQ
jgi:exosome complex component RRP41